MPTKTDCHYFTAPPQNCLHSYAFAQALVFIAPSSESVQLINSIYFNVLVGLEFQQLSSELAHRVFQIC